MAYYESEPSGGNFNANNQSTEKSIKSCYAVVYELENRKWVVAGEGGWSEVHLCEDSLDNSYRILAWTVKSQQVLMNCNVTAECTYKEKSKNFHSFSDENGNRYGLGFHKSESGLKQAAHFLKSVISVINQCKEDLNPSPPAAPDLPYQQQQQQQSPSKMSNSSTPQHPSSTPSGPSSISQSQEPGGMPPPNPYQSKPQQSPQQQNKSNQYGMPPPMFSQMDNQQNNAPQQQPQQNNGYNQAQNNHSYQQQQQAQKQKYHPPPAQLQQSTTSSSYNHANKNNNNQYAIDVNAANNNHPPPNPMQSPSPIINPARSASPGPAMTPKLNGMKGNFQPTYHLKTEQHKTIPMGNPGPMGNLKILPPKPQKHYSGDKKIKNPTAVEHKVRVTHDKDTGAYSGLPAEWLEHLNKQFGVHPKQLPGVQLDLYQSKIPKVLITLRAALEEANAYQQVGIFRLAPNASDNKAMKEKINKGQLENEEKIDVNVYANLIKVWFRDLPDPLLNAVNPDLIEHVQSQDDAANVITNFPEPNKSIFLWLCDMCCDIAQYEKINKMGAENMAIVVAPNLFNTDKFENPMKAMTYSQKVVEFFKHSILWRQKVRGY